MIGKSNALLAALTIKNYALIDHLEVGFSDGMTTITGETGAGKSILLGALALVLGKRADRSVLYQADQKCVVEAQFEISNYDLAPFFDTHALDYETRTILRREVIPNGKSRAFINDTPVTLEVMDALGQQLIDIHAQHQTLKLTQNDFQYSVVDARAGLQEDVKTYQDGLGRYKNLEQQIAALQQQQQLAQQETDYNSFLLQELEAENLQANMLEPLEEQVAQWSNVEDLQQYFNTAIQCIENEQQGVLEQLATVRSVLNQAASKAKKYQELSNRITSLSIELQDILSELMQAQDQLEMNPQELEHAQQQLQRIYDLFKKHGVQEVTALIEKQQELNDSLQGTTNREAQLTALTKEKESLKEHLDAQAKSLFEKRNAILPNLTKQLQGYVAQMGMVQARFQIQLVPTASFEAFGKDQLELRFAANDGSPFQALKKVASGGELSRIMLAIKALLAQYQKLPTIIFDEIDTGVSGAISNEIALIMKAMAAHMQVFTITHLPQVAAKGQQHFKVYKTTYDTQTRTQIRELNAAERVEEIAQMLSGNELTQTAREHALQLLN